MNSLLLIAGALMIAALFAHWRLIVIGRHLAAATSDSADGLKESECFLSWKWEIMRRKLQAIKRGEFGADLCDVASRALFFDNLFIGLSASAMLLFVTTMLAIGKR